MNKAVWLKRSDEWIKENPGKGTMYKGFISNSTPSESLSVINGYVKKKIYQKRERADRGIYIIMCEPAKSVYVGQSINIGIRLRSHKYIISKEAHEQDKKYKRMISDRVKYGMESFLFKKHLLLPDADSEDLINKENEVMSEFISKGYSLYNRSIPANIHCPGSHKSLVDKIIKCHDYDLLSRIEKML